MRKDIIIIDDDRDLCTLLQESLLQENICADISCNGFDGIKSVKDKEYQLVVLDVMMPGISGFEVLERIRDMSNVPILMLTAKDDSTSKVKGLRAGADDYLTKPFEMEEFFARVLSLIRRYTRLNNMASKAILKYGDLRIDLESGIVELSGEELKLSAKEYDVLIYLAKNQGKILTKKQIYENVWEDEAYGAENIIAVHIRHIREKIEINPREPRYLKVIWGIGYKIENLDAIPEGINGFLYEKLTNLDSSYKIVIDNEVDFEIAKVLSFRKYLSLCEALGVLLDNAIEATREADVKYIRISFACQNNLLLVEVTNSFKNFG